LALAWRGCGGIAPNGSPDALVACRYALLCLQRISAQHRTLEQPNEVRLGNRQRDAFSFGFSDRANLIYHQLWKKIWVRLKTGSVMVALSKEVNRLELLI
jgi:hypothetical protein